jgi:hypothetical protein
MNSGKMLVCLAVPFPPESLLDEPDGLAISGVCKVEGTLDYVAFHSATFYRNSGRGTIPLGQGEATGRTLLLLRYVTRPARNKNH